MPKDTYTSLDNPAWSALQTVHKEFAIGDGIKRYPGDVLKIFACEQPSGCDLKEVEPLIGKGERMYMVGDIAPLPSNWRVEAQLECIQMICENLVPLTRAPAEIIQLVDTDIDQMLELINLVQPGFFYRKTPELGGYFGIKMDGRLVAMAGERLRMTGFSEVSAVVTHPDFTGRGYAQNLVAHVAMNNIEAGVTPFLQFLKSNTRARKVYELLGFRERKEIMFTRFCIG